MITDKEDMVFVSQHALSCCDIEGKPIVERSEKRVPTGEDLAILEEMVAEREYAINTFYEETKYESAPRPLRTKKIQVIDLYFSNLMKRVRKLFSIVPFAGANSTIPWLDRQKTEDITSLGEADPVYSVIDKESEYKPFEENCLNAILKPFILNSAVG